MKKKLINYIRSTRHKIKESISWHRTHLYFNYSVPFGTALHIIISLLFVFVLFFSFQKLVMSSNMLLISEQGIPYLNINYATDYISTTGILGSQITLTLICVSLLALVSSIEKKYIYGERLIDLAFSNKFPFTFKCAMLSLFALLITNVSLMLKNKPLVYTILVFLITLYLSIVILYRFLTVFLGQHSLKNMLLRKYYKCNIKQLKKSKPIENYISIPMDNLKATTLKHLICNDIPELNENMRLYFRLLELSLYNKPNLVQEYYTEKMNCQDAIGHIIELSLNMLHLNRPLDGLRTYNALLKKVNYFKIVGTTNIYYLSPAHSFIDAFADIKNNTQLKSYISQLLNMTSALIEQCYLQTTVDLSYCRLAKHKMIYFHSYNDFYERIYDAIVNSSILSADEKQEMLDNMRMNIISLYVGSGLYNDIDCFRSKERHKIDKRIYSLEIKGEQTARLFLRMVEDNDSHNLWMYHSLGSGHTTAYFARILTILSVLNMIYTGNKKEYLCDINIDEDSSKQLFKRCKMLQFDVTEQELIDYHNFISKHYVIDLDSHKTTPSGGIYGFNPKFQFYNKVVGTYFSYMLQKLKKNSVIKEIAEKYSYQYCEAVEHLIHDFE